MPRLFLPSRSVRDICSFAEKTFIYSLKANGGKMLLQEFAIDKMNLCDCKNFMENKTLFDYLENHFRENPKSFHYYILIKSISTLYPKVRVHYLSKINSFNSGTLIS
jgi:hypothetical protein